MIGIITYDAAHRKTQDLVTKLILNGYPSLHLVVIPWVNRKSIQPIFHHRPSTAADVSIEDLCERFKTGFSMIHVAALDKFFTTKSFDHILVAGAGLLPQELTQNHKIINSHPGYLPNMKGLDAFKWSVYSEQPIGVTTHYISAKADEGKLIERTIVPVYFEDTFHNVAYRVYETEIDMLVNSISLIENNSPTYEILDDTRYTANKRMPHNYEIVMMSKFEEMRKRSPSHTAKD
jgi:phosphoribosylglycinamide formyltransferase-1